MVFFLNKLAFKTSEEERPTSEVPLTNDRIHNAFYENKRGATRSKTKNKRDFKPTNTATMSHQKKNKKKKTREYPAKTTLAGVQQGLPLILPNYCSNRRVD